MALEKPVWRVSLLSDLLVRAEDTYRKCAVRVANCSVGDDFRSIWTKIFFELDIDAKSYFPDYRTPNPDQLRRLLSLVDPYMVIVVDEYDRVDDDEALSLMADTIKALSDHAVGSKLVSLASPPFDRKPNWRTRIRASLPRGGSGSADEGRRDPRARDAGIL